MTKTTGGGKQRALAVLCGGLLAGLAIAAATLFIGRDELLAEKLIAALSGATPPAAERIFAQAQRLGPAGIDVLVAGLAAADRGISAQAGRHLWAMLDGWETLGAEEIAPRLQRLAESLTTHAAAFSPPARETAGTLATRILLWPLGADDAGRGVRVAACERLLRDLHQGAGRRPGDRGFPKAPVVAENAVGDDPAKQFAADLAPLATATLPGGGLPLSTDAAPQRREAVASQARDPAPSHSSDDKVAAQPVSSSWRPARDAVSLLKESEVVTIAAEEEQSPSEVDEKRSALLARLQSTPQALSSFDLCRLTHDADRQVVEAARAELLLRRIDPRLIELGRMVTDPNVETRLAWTEQLTRIAGIDAEPWLVALLDDESPAVRRAALAILVTVPGKQHAPRIAQMAAGDPAADVRELAARALKSR